MSDLSSNCVCLFKRKRCVVVVRNVWEWISDWGRLSRSTQVLFSLCKSLFICSCLSFWGSNNLLLLLLLLLSFVSGLVVTSHIPFVIAFRGWVHSLAVYCVASSVQVFTIDHPRPSHSPHTHLCTGWRRANARSLTGSRWWRHAANADP